MTVAFTIGGKACSTVFIYLANRPNSLKIDKILCYCSAINAQNNPQNPIDFLL